MPVEAPDHAIHETGANVLHDKRRRTMARKGRQHRFQRAHAACGRTQNDERRRLRPDTTAEGAGRPSCRAIAPCSRRVAGIRREAFRDRRRDDEERRESTSEAFAACVRRAVTINEKRDRKRIDEVQEHVQPVVAGDVRRQRDGIGTGALRDMSKASVRGRGFQGGARRKARHDSPSPSPGSGSAIR
jgi:hypothetical protein